MKFATISHLLNKKNLKQLPASWIKNQLIISPELNIDGTKGYLIALNLLPNQIMGFSREEIRKQILNATLYAQDKLNVDLIQLGALTTSVTDGGIWLTNQKEFTGYVTHGDSYTAAVTCQAVMKSMQLFNKNPKYQSLAIVGAYGIIGEAVSKILVPMFEHSFLIGRRKEKLKELDKKLQGDFETTIDLETRNADIVVTVTSHPSALLDSNHLKEYAIVIDVSQPPNLSNDVCQKRPDICRIDGGYVDFPMKYYLPLPNIPPGKQFACIAEVIMQSMEKDHKSHVGSIDLKYLKKTEKWAEKYGFTLSELTNFGSVIQVRGI